MQDGLQTGKKDVIVDFDHFHPEGFGLDSFGVTRQFFVFFVLIGFSLTYWSA
jgi:hypothetical protein